MPFNVKQSASGVEKEILRFPVGLHAVKSVVLDATDVGWGIAAGVRNVAPAGTILRLSATNPNQYVKYTGGAAGTIRGVLGRPIDLAAQATAGDEPAPMFFFGCVFATDAIVGFTQFASALVNDLGNYNKFE